MAKKKSKPFRMRDQRRVNDVTRRLATLNQFDYAVNSTMILLAAAGAAAELLKERHEYTEDDAKQFAQDMIAKAIVILHDEIQKVESVNVEQRSKQKQQPVNSGNA